LLTYICPSWCPTNSTKSPKVECDIINVVLCCCALQGSKDNGIFRTSSYVDGCQTRSSISWLSYADLSGATSDVTKYNIVFLIISFTVHCLLNRCICCVNSYLLFSVIESVIVAITDMLSHKRLHNC